MIMIALALAASSSSLPLAVVAGREHALAQLDQLAHRFLLELQPQVLSIDANPVERRIAVQHLWRSRMSAYSIGKMSDDPRHSDVVSVSGAGLPASAHARAAADAAASFAASSASTITSTL